MNNIKLYTLSIIVLMLFSSSALTQSLDTLWTKTYWINQFDSANCVQETSDKGFIIAGATQVDNENQHDINLIKTDSLGNEEWTKQLGDSTHQCAFHILQASDGGYLVSASSYAIVPGVPAVWIVKTDNLGDTLWSYSFIPEDRGSFPLYAVETVDSGYAITGLLNLSGTFNDAFILKLDKDGNYIDYSSYGDSFNQDGRFITQLPDSGYIVTGWESNIYTTGDDYRAFRTDKHLNILWDSTYALTDFSDEIYGACRLDDGIVMVGQARAAGHALKIDFDGNTVWSKSISQYATGERNTSVCPTADGGLMVGGWLTVAGHRRDFSFLKLNDLGDVMSTFTVGGFQDDHAQYIIPTSDSNYVMVGLSYSFGNGTCSFLTKVKEFYNTQVGNNVDVNLDYGCAIHYDIISDQGETSIEVDSTGPVLPGAYNTVPTDPVTYYHLSTTATYSGNIEICINYDPINVTAEESTLTLQHFDGLTWNDITSSIDTVNNVVCGTTSSLSPFILAQPIPTDIEDIGDKNLPDFYELHQNYPNPFNPQTTVEFSIASRSKVVIEIFNIFGQKIKILVDEEKSAGSYRVIWNGEDNNGQKVSSGIYFYRFATKDHIDTKKMLLLK